MGRGFDVATHRTLPPAIRRGLLLSVGVSLVGIVWLNFRTVTPATLGHLRRANFVYVALACAAMALAWLTEAWRIQLLLRFSGDTIGLWRLFRIVLATFFSASVTPFASGQGPVQIYLLHREGPSLGRATAILTLRLFLTVVAFTMGIPLLLLLVRLGITARVHALANWGILASFALAAVFFLFLRNPHGVARGIHTFTTKYLSRLFRPESVDQLLSRLVAEVDEFTATLGHLDQSKVVLLSVAVLLTILYWILYFAAAPLLLLAFGRSFDPVRVMALQAVFTFLISMVPIPGGSGLAELGFAQVFSHLLPPSLVGVFVSLWRVITYYLPLLVGALSFAQLLAGGGQSSTDGGTSKV